MTQDDSGNKPKEPQHPSSAPPPIKPVSGRGGQISHAWRTTAQEPNWDEWKHIPEVRVWQACALSLNIDPHSMKGLRDGWMAGPGHGPLFEPESFPSKDAKAKFELRQRVLLANLSNREFFSAGILNMVTPGNHGVRLSEFAAWAASEMKWDDMPPELMAMCHGNKKESEIESTALRPDLAIYAGGINYVDPEHEGTATPNDRPQQQQRYQESEILRVIRELGHTAAALPKVKTGRSGVKSQVRQKLKFTASVFNKAWERLRADGRIADSDT